MNTTRRRQSVKWKIANFASYGSQSSVSGSSGDLGGIAWSSGAVNSKTRVSLSGYAGFEGFKTLDAAVNNFFNGSLGTMVTVLVQYFSQNHFWSSNNRDSTSEEEDGGASKKGNIVHWKTEDLIRVMRLWRISLSEVQQVTNVKEVYKMYEQIVVNWNNSWDLWRIFGTGNKWG